MGILRFLKQTLWDNINIADRILLILLIVIFGTYIIICKFFVETDWGIMSWNFEN